MSDCKSSLQHSSPGKAHGYDHMVLNQSDFLSHDQVQMLGPELNLTEMSEGEYTHLQHIIQTHMETQAEVSDMSADQNTSMDKDTVMSPLPTIQAIDLSIISDGREVILPGEKTPPYGEVPGFVLAKIRGEDTTSGTGSLPSHRKGPSTTRVCLEKRFNSIPGTLRHQDLQSSVLSNFLMVVQQPSETQDASTHCHLQRWIRCDTGNELSSPFIEMHKSVTNMSAPRVKSRPTKDISNSPGETGSSVRKRGHRVLPLSLRRERHNSKERERRRRIRLCCDELNVLVPFCHADTDKVTTLQWTAAYLRYINQMYGDTLKKEFEKTYTDKDGLKLDPSSVNDLILRNTQNIPMSVEP
ncbi:uncharacterized protein LOC110164466 [Boleophthalmus pectinirostris]|uniref:uncharacterized protein LOC110164466 n=1 Tax=Boleophthalmus pectinirostris TaxID=150288 RepID=UPI0024323D1F|nr:uncharacterized protein LOC110164466 [Boleophthalmus pectinirostris]